MDDDPCLQFFAQPTNPHHRRYEALRAVFVEGRSLQEVADAFGYRYATMRQMVYELRRHCRDGNDGSKSPFFER